MPLDEIAFRLLAAQSPISVQFEAKPGAWTRAEEWLAVLGLMDVRPIHVALGAAVAAAVLAAGLAALLHLR